MARRRWFLVPLALALVAVAAGVVAVRAGEVPEPATGATPAGQRVATPVLSARRVGPLLSQRISLAEIRSVLDEFIATVPPETCLSVLSPGGGVIYQHQPDLPVIPASTQKLVTATAVLTELGPDARFRTRVLASSPPTPEGVIQGDVWLVGGGDPLLSTQAYADHFFSQPQRYTPPRQPGRRPGRGGGHPDRRAHPRRRVPLRQSAGGAVVVPPVRPAAPGGPPVGHHGERQRGELRAEAATAHP